MRHGTAALSRRMALHQKRDVVILSTSHGPPLAPGWRNGSPWPFLFRASFVHGNGPPRELFTMQSCDRRPTFCIVAHGHKRETARTAGLSIVDDTDLSYSAKLFENILKISFGRIER
jgi:hypothetical protein